MKTPNKTELQILKDMLFNPSQGSTIRFTRKAVGTDITIFVQKDCKNYWMAWFEIDGKADSYRFGNLSYVIMGISFAAGQAFEQQKALSRV